MTDSTDNARVPEFPAEWSQKMLALDEYVTPGAGALAARPHVDPDAGEPYERPGMRLYADRKYGHWGLISALLWVNISAPWNLPLFSERNGLRKSVIRFRGWRLFMRVGKEGRK